MKTNDNLIFSEEIKNEETKFNDGWKVLVVDDEKEVHDVTCLALQDVVYQQRTINFISAFSGKEAKALVKKHDDIALILLDVVMEEDHAGLDVIRYIREDLGNHRIRIILRTGQPGQAPENEVIVNYDINDYKAKSELTAQKLFTTVISSLRSFRHLSTIESNKEEMSRLYRKLKKYSTNLETKNIKLKTEIIERKKAERKIQEQAALLDISRDAILVQNNDNQIVFWSKGAESLYDLTAEEAVRKYFAEMISTDCVQDYNKAQEIVREKGEWTGELQQITKKGEEIIVQSRWTLMLDDNGNAKSVLMVNTDITEKKNIEAQLLRSQRLDSLGTLAGGIAHDLNNVLTPILLSVEILKMKGKDQDSLKLINIIKSSASRGAALVKQILTFVRGSGAERKEIPITPLIKEIVKMSLDTFPKSIAITTDIEDDLWRVRGDLTQLYQVLLNLCVNARDAMPEGGSLRFAAENIELDENFVAMIPDGTIGSYVLISVSDTGTGIPPEVVDKIFDPLFTTKEPGKGTGLGLSTVATITKSHNGFIDLKSTPGSGTSFKLYFPACKEAAEDPETNNISNMLVGRGEYVLVVDDEASVCEIIRGTLESYGYNVLTADSGKNAIACYTDNQDKVASVFVDMIMPDMDGVATMRGLKRINPDIKIIATSGEVTPEDQLTSIEVDKNSFFLEKPFTAEKLLQTLKQALTA